MEKIAQRKRALKLKPQDYSLWNKLGATQANSVQSADAIMAYQQMSFIPKERAHNGNLKNPEVLDKTRALNMESAAKVRKKVIERPKVLNIERQRSCDERSMSELSMAIKAASVNN
ncbi:hypothetical protein Fmac_015792 [Flemingia macrophylla]|uniref:Uncharacterized protein n=1 Tax=Flemingia macrophylla TaxID=520843 RepID=A0ABD1MFQ7_9FABA